MSINQVNFKYDNQDRSIFIHSKDWIGKMIIQHQNYYEHQLLTFIKSNFSELLKGGVVIDVGANIGNHSKFFREEMNMMVIAFEPVQDNVQLFELNCKISDEMTLHKVALSDHAGEMTLYNSEKDNFGGFSLHQQPKSFVVEENIKVNTLDSFNL